MGTRHCAISARWRSTISASGAGVSGRASQVANRVGFGADPTLDVIAREEESNNMYKYGRDKYETSLRLKNPNLEPSVFSEFSQLVEKHNAVCDTGPSACCPPAQFKFQSRSACYH